jgi:hypothetical protein
MAARPAIIGLLLIGFGSLTLTRSAAATGGFVVLVHQSNAVSSMSHSALQRVVSGETKQWDNGAVVQLGVIPSIDAPETIRFASLVDMSPREFLSFIQQQVFKGEVRRPAVLRFSADCAAFVRATTGAICVASDDTPIPPEAHVVSVL